MRSAVCALISSPDIPEYVAYCRCMDQVRYVQVGEKSYPMIGLNYRSSEFQEIDTPDGQSGTWFGCKEEGEW
jgi:hypothetical protein